MTSAEFTGPAANQRDGTAGFRGSPDVVPRVVWTRSDQCRSLAEVIAGDRSTRAGPDLAESCVESRASLLVTRRLTSFDLCSVAVPHEFSEEAVSSVVAAVGGGPHPLLAAAVAQRIADRLGVPGRAVYGHDGDEGALGARGVLSEVCLLYTSDAADDLTRVDLG